MTDQNLKASLILDLDSDIASQSRKDSRALESFSKNGQRNMGAMRRSVKRTDSALFGLSRRLVAFASGAVIGAAVKKGASKVIDFDAVLTQLAVDANFDKEAQADLKNKILEIANLPDIRIPRGELAAGIAKINAQTGDADFAVKNVEALGVMIRATGAAGEDAAALIANFFEKFDIKDPKVIFSLLGISSQMGKEGAFEVRDLATEGNTVSTAFASLGRVGSDAVIEMLALLQIVRRSTPSSSEAGTAFGAMIANLIQNEDMLAANGIQIWQPEQLKLGNEVARPLHEILLDIFEATGAKQGPLRKIFNERGIKAVNAFALEYNKTGGLPSMDKFLAMTGDGSSLRADAARNAATAKAAIAAINNTAFATADTLLSGPLKGLADEFNNKQRNKNEQASITQQILDASTPTTRPIQNNNNELSPRVDKTVIEISASPELLRLVDIKTLLNTNNQSTEAGMNMGGL